MIKLLYHDSTYTLGSFFNTLGYPPNIEFVSIHKNEGIVIVSLVEQLGMVEYQITLFEFDPTHNALYKHCNFSDVSIHNTEMDTLENIKHYDYKIQGNQFLIDEYYPYKSTAANSKYVVKSKSCFLNRGK